MIKLSVWSIFIVGATINIDQIVNLINIYCGSHNKYVLEDRFPEPVFDELWNNIYCERHNKYWSYCQFDQYVGKKSETNSAPFFKPRFLRDLGFKIMDSFGQYFTSFAFFKYDQPNPTYRWDVKNQKNLLTYVRTGLDEYLRARIEQK